MITVGPKPKVEFEIKHTIMVVKSVLTTEQCNDLIQSTELKGLQLGKSKNEHLWKAQFKSTLLPDANHWIYDKLANYYMLYIAKTNISINFLEHYEIKKYEEGDFFENHRDNYFALDSKQDRKVNLICQLSDEHSYNGGEFKLGSFTFTKKQGSILLFPATYMHEVTKVTSGTRYSLIGHAWGPNWI